MDETSPSKRMYKVGQQLVFYSLAGMWAGEIDYPIDHANNNWRKMHGLPLYHRNKPSRRLRDRCLIKQYETEHEEEMEWLH